MKSNDVAKYVSLQPASGIYRYYRRVPTEVAKYDKRVYVRQSLKTKNLKEAIERAEAIHKAVEALWKAMLAGNENATAYEQYAAAVAAAQSLGFTYLPSEAAAAVDAEELIRRAAIAKENRSVSATIVQGALGIAPDPAPRLSNVWSLYEEHNASGLTGMSKNQLRAHKNSRKRAIRYAIEALDGDRELGGIKRPDILAFRSWWTEKIAREKLKAYSANRCFSDIMGMLTIIDDALKTNYKEPWGKSRLKETNATKLGTRPPFPIDWVQQKILAPGALDDMNEDAQMIVYAMVETGARLGEICNLRPQDIRLDDEVPHIEVAERDDRRQKTDYSIRRIPLVGVSLWAMKKRPQGFPRYADNANAASALINKIMKKHGLCPTKRHTVYSLRHTFQDRIENAQASDRMQADLMGHEFGRPRYGDGPEMKRRQEFLDRIKFTWEGPDVQVSHLSDQQSENAFDCIRE